MSIPLETSFDAPSYIKKIEHRTKQLEKETDSQQSSIEQRDNHILFISQNIKENLKTLQETMLNYQNQLDNNKKNLLALLQLYKLCARLDAYTKLQDRADSLPFDKFITRKEFNKLISEQRELHG